MGITSAMPLYEAKKICNNLEIYRQDMEYYSESSNKFYEYLKKIFPRNRKIFNRWMFFGINQH